MSRELVVADSAAYQATAWKGSFVNGFAIRNHTDRFMRANII